MMSWPAIPNFSSQKNNSIMKVQIEISNETLQTILNGKRVEGSLGLMPSSSKESKQIGFNAYHRRPCKKRPDRLVCHLEHGWVKESVERIKMYESVPKHLGAVGVGHVLQREAKRATEALLDCELDEIMFG